MHEVERMCHLFSLASGIQLLTRHQSADPAFLNCTMKEGALKLCHKATEGLM